MCLLIVAFWLGMMSWLAYRDIWPQLRPGQPPPYTIDLADEAQLHAPRIRWVLLQDGPRGEERIGRARTWVTYSAADNTFEMHNEINDLNLKKGLLTVRVRQMTSVYHVSLDGDLQGFRANLAAVVPLPLLLGQVEFHADVTGDVKDGRFSPAGKLTTPFADPIDLAMDPVDVPAHGSLLNPLHPVNRIKGLRPGQQWRVPRFDPLFECLTAAASKKLKLGSLAAGPRFLDAEVLAGSQVLTWNRRPVECLVIEYRSDEVAGRTWVRKSDGLVLRQEAGTGKDRLILQRE
jgi:hypothetical protein